MGGIRIAFVFVALLLVCCQLSEGQILTGEALDTSGHRNGMHDVGAVPKQLADEDTATRDSSKEILNLDEECWSVQSQLKDLALDACESRTTKESVILGTYNIYWLFDGDSDRKEVWESPEEAHRHLRDIADVIRKHKPDILTLVEVEDEEILQELIDDIGDPAYAPWFVQGRDSATGQDVALITIGDLVRNISRTNCNVDDVPNSSCGVTLDKNVQVTKNQIALFDSCLFGMKFALISIHFYAFPSRKDRCIQREAQALVIQDAIAKLIAAGFEVIVAGDLNDYSDKYEDVNEDEQPISRVLSILRRPNNSSEDELDNVMHFLPQSQSYTAWWDGGGDRDGSYDGPQEASQIDHILMTKGLFNRIKRVWIDHEPDPEVISDHWPLFVELNTDQPPAT